MNPLLLPDPDAVLDLQAALNAIYSEAGYDLSIDYNKLPPPPAFSKTDIEWMQARLADY
uniref:DUF4058 family protein n=1 Tax=Hassallia byssoidea TaxID=482630 RepID=UPI003013774A